MPLEVILGFDNSASMQTPLGDTTRIGKAKELAGSIIQKACQLDASGPDVYSFGSKVTYLGNVTAEQASEKLSSLNADEYATGLGEFLTQAFIKASEIISNGNNALILVITDGAATDKPLVKSEIIQAANALTEDNQLALEIVYLSDEAKTYLAELDDNLKDEGAKFDVVDATSIEDAVALEVEALLNKAFND